MADMRKVGGRGLASDEMIRDHVLTLTREERIRFMVRMAHATAKMRVVVVNRRGDKVIRKRTIETPRAT